MDVETGQLSKEEHDRYYLDVEKEEFSGKIASRAATQATAVFLAGQPGAGKRKLSEAVRSGYPAKSTLTIGAIPKPHRRTFHRRDLPRSGEETAGDQMTRGPMMCKPRRLARNL